MSTLAKSKPTTAKAAATTKAARAPRSKTSTGSTSKLASKSKSTSKPASKSTSISNESDTKLPDNTVARLDQKDPNLSEKYAFKPQLEIEEVIIDKQNRKTSDWMSEYEYTRILSIRSSQLEKNINMSFGSTSDIPDLEGVAIEEIRQKKCPLSVRREVARNIYEIWDVNELYCPFLATYKF